MSGPSKVFDDQIYENIFFFTEEIIESQWKYLVSNFNIWYVLACRPSMYDGGNAAGNESDWSDPRQVDQI